MKTITLVLWSFTALLLGSCGNSKEIDDKKNETVPKEVTHQDISGVDFYANAEDESWKLSITFDEEIVFTDTKNNIQFSSKNIDKQVAQGADVEYCFWCQ